ncbi:MAG: 2TM domain-containing protein [Moorea sp. SIO2B7]|nr:2TM domain-containing protein [Moorena sp. SIO2B7]
MSASQIQHPQSYSQEEIQQILHLAIARKSDHGELSREQLWEIAAELEIDKDAIQAAEQDWLKGRVMEQKRHAFNLYRRDRLQQKAIKYLIVNGFLISINFLGAGTISWSLYVLLFWGLGLALESWKTFQSKGEAYEKAFQSWNLKHEMKRSMESLWDKLQKAWQT